MTSALRVLYVDDEPDLLEISKLFLEASGDFTVTTSLSAPEAIRLLEQEKFDAIISDYQMPGMDGIQFLVEVRTRFGPIPFILFTGRGREEIVIQAINSGADFYLQKGGEPDAQFAELSHKVKSAASSKRADDSLRESEIRHRTILQTTKDGFWIIELPGGQLTEVNETYCRMSGYTRAELLKKHIPDLDAVKTPDEQAETLQSIIKNGSGIFETRHHRKDGSVFDVELSVTYQNTNGGELICFCRDITDRKRAEEALRESEERYRTIYDQSPVSIELYDAAGALIHINPACLNLFGVENIQTIQNFSLFADPNISDEQKEKLRQGETVQYQGPFDFKKVKTLHLYPTSREGIIWLDVLITPLGDRANSITGFLVQIKDISDRKRAEEALREEQHFSKLMLDNLPGIFYLYTYPEHQLTRWNKQHETLLGYTADELKGKLASDWHLPELKDAVLKATKEVMELGQSSVESNLIAKDGHTIPFYLTGVRFEAQDRLYYMGIGIDITERKRAEEALLKNTEELHAAYEQLTASEEELRQNVDDLSRSKRELSESEEKFRVIADYTVNWESWFGTDGKYIWVSPSVAQFTGYLPEEILAMPDFISTVIAKEDRALFTERFGEAIQGTSGENFEFRYLHRNGTKHWLNVSWQPIVDMNGNSLGTRASGHDITGRKHAEEALRTSEEKYRKAFFTSPNAICITRLNDGMFISINKGFTEITGYTEEDVIGKTSLEINIWKDPEDRRKIVEGLQAYGEVRNYEARFLTKTGEIYGSMSTSVIELNGVPHILNITSDITKRKVAEEALLKNTEELHSAYEKLTASEEKLRQNVEDLTKSEQALRTFNAYNRNLLEASLDPLVTINSEGKIADVNASTEKVTGYSREELIGTDFSDYFTEPEQAKDGYQRVFADGTVRNYPLSIRNRDGHITPVLYNATVYRDEIGKVNGVFAAAHDITERKKAEEALLKKTEDLHSANEQLTATDEELRQTIDELGSSEKVLRTLNAYNRSLLEASLDSLVTINPDGKISDVNTTTEKITGYSREELIGTDFSDYFTEPEQAKDGYQRVFTDGTVRNYPLNIRHRDGHITPVLYNATVYRDESGKVSGVFAAARDITERKRMEEALQKNEEKYHNLFMTGADGIVIHDAQGRNIDANAQACEMLGYSHSELLAMRVSDLIPPEELQQKPPRLTDVLAGQPVCYERKLRRKDGTLLDMEIRASRVTEGTVQAFWRDITERKRAEEAIREANKKLTLLSSITRHDINNQLTVLRGYLTILEKKQPDPTLNEYFKKAATAAQQISTMIQFTKEYEKIGVNTPVWQDVRTVLDTAAKQAPLGKVMVKNDLPKAEVFADPLIVKVAYNLIDNAVRYGMKITTIRFSVEESGDDHLIVCEDDGEGVPAEEKEKIFERGFGKNTGLGLFLAREILDITGITIKETGVPGKGARFEMMVPKGAWRKAVEGA